MLRLLRSATSFSLTFLIAGCAAPQFDWSVGTTTPAETGGWSPAIEFTAESARNLPIFQGESGRRLDWDELQPAFRWADVIVVGEQHDDAVGHAVQLAVTQDTLAQRPGGSLALEMLERDEQHIVDDFLDGIIDAATLARLTHSEKWAGEDSWTNWYQPIIDAAKAAGAGVVAANAPRQYVRLARTDGYARLKLLPKERRALFDLPKPLLDDGYRQRFFDLMNDGHATGGTDSATPPEDPAAVARRVADGFRSQQLWDATMGASVVRALRGGSRPVILLVGQFHSDFNGGTVQQIRARRPNSKILVISMQREDSTTLRDEDRSRADIIIYTGARPPEEEPVAEEEPEEAQPEPDDDATTTEPYTDEAKVADDIDDIDDTDESDETDDTSPPATSADSLPERGRARTDLID